jgi:hypothetical protein
VESPISRKTVLDRARGWQRAFAALSFVIFALAVYTSFPAGSSAIPAQVPALLLFVAGGGLYVAAHVMRAMRLAVIGVQLLGVSFRTVMLLHLFVAPWSLILPFKLDELIRIRELQRASGSLVWSVLTSLIDRSMDGLVLVTLALVLIADGRGRLAGLSILIGAGLLTIAILLLVMPVLLEAVQRHVFLNHLHDRALDLLRAVTNCRKVLDHTRAAIGEAAPFLALFTLGIWAMELSATMLVLGGITGTVPGVTAIGSMLGRADHSALLVWNAVTASPAERLLTIVFLWSLLLTWLGVASPYLRRLRREPSRASLFPLTTGFPRLSWRR